MAVKTEGINFLFYANLRGWKVSGFSQGFKLSRFLGLNVSGYQGVKVSGADNSDHWYEKSYGSLAFV